MLLVEAPEEKKLEAMEVKQSKIEYSIKLAQCLSAFKKLRLSFW